MSEKHPDEHDFNVKFGLFDVQKIMRLTQNILYSFQRGCSAAPWPKRTTQGVNSSHTICIWKGTKIGTFIWRLQKLLSTQTLVLFLLEALSVRGRIDIMKSIKSKIKWKEHLSPSKQLKQNHRHQLLQYIMLIQTHLTKLAVVLLTLFRTLTTRLAL